MSRMNIPMLAVRTVSQGRAEVLRWMCRAPIGEARQIRSGENKGKWISIGMTPVMIRRTRGELMSALEATR